ncbi:MAG: hypothetical protein QNK37_09550 [Acidobacteriota bacterium]|nr:hypothetical protein [Acidobacteriota bacterium]
MLFSLLLCLALDTGMVEIVPEIYEPLRRYEIAMAPDGSLYLLHFRNKKVLHYSPDGKLLNSFGKKGNGPGEFQFPFYLSLLDGKVYVNDVSQRAHHIFDLKGNLIGMYKTPEFGLNTQKVKDGWIAAQLTAMNPQIPIATFRFNEKLEGKQEIDSWPRPKGANSTIQMRPSGGGKPIMMFNPVRDRPLFKRDRDGRYLYLYYPKGFHIKVLDGNTGKVVNTITRDLQPIPFDEEYGKQQLADFKEKNRGIAMQATLEGNYPDYFPVIRDIFISPDNHLGIRRWSAKDIENGPILVIDKDGKDVQTAYPKHLARRIMYLHQGHGWLNVFDPEDEEAILMRVPMDKLEATAKANIFDSSAEKARPMVRSN